MVGPACWKALCCGLCRRRWRRARCAPCGRSRQKSNALVGLATPPRKLLGGATNSPQSICFGVERGDVSSSAGGKASGEDSPSDAARGVSGVAAVSEGGTVNSDPAMVEKQRCRRHPAKEGDVTTSSQLHCRSMAACCCTLESSSRAAGGIAERMSVPSA